MSLHHRYGNVSNIGGDIMEVPTRLSGLPFTLGQHSNLQALQSSGNMALDGSAFTLHNHVFSDGLTLFGQFGQIFPSLQDTRHGNAALQKTLEAPSAHTHSPSHQEGSRDPRPTRSNDGNSGKSSSHYASRHQAAEQRRRTRINERLDLLRKLVPHSDRANTASFLEEVLKYIDTLKARVVELEAMQTANAAANAAPADPSHAPSSSAAHARTDAQVSGFRVALPQLGVGNTGPTSGQHGQPLNVNYCLHQLQQEQLKQLLQQQHDAAVTALQQQEDQHQQQKAAIMAAHQLRQQQEIAAVRQAAQMADLATQLGLKTVPGMAQAQQGGSRADPGMDGLYMKRSSRDTRSSPLVLASTSNGAHTHTATRHLVPVQHIQTGNDISVPTFSAPPAAANPSVEVRKANSGSPVSSEESGVPLKKRKVLLL